MFRAFNFDTTGFNVSHGSAGAFAQEKNIVTSLIFDFFNYDGSVNVEKIKESWFPSKNKYDVFISHAHKDENEALELQKILKTEFSLSCFIDSTLWGNFLDLEKSILSRIKIQANDTEKFVRANVSMILLSALADVIDNSDCLFFLNTSNSIVPQIESKNKATVTESMWIFHELNTARIIRLRDPGRRINPRLLDEQNKITAGLESITFHHPVYLDHFPNINHETLDKMKGKIKSNITTTRLRSLAGNTSNNEPTHPLDLLYNLTDMRHQK